MDKTTEPIKPGTSEFGRHADVTRVFGIKRGTAYNLLNSGKIKGCLLRVMGAKSGVRLFDMASVRSYINGQMIAQSRGRKLTAQ